MTVDSNQSSLRASAVHIPVRPVHSVDDLLALSVIRREAAWIQGLPKGGKVGLFGFRLKEQSSASATPTLQSDKARWPRAMNAETLQWTWSLSWRGRCYNHTIHCARVNFRSQR